MRHGFLPLHLIFLIFCARAQHFYCAGGAKFKILRISCEVRGSSLKNFSRTLFSKICARADRSARKIRTPSVRKGCPQWENHTSFWRAEFPDGARLDLKNLISRGAASAAPLEGQRSKAALQKQLRSGQRSAAKLRCPDRDF